MRLIDADRYREEFLNSKSFEPMKLLDMQPTVNAVQHGTWIGVEYDGFSDGNPVYDVYECSVCREEHYGEMNTLTDYCPCCGAKMDISAATETITEQ